MATIVLVTVASAGRHPTTQPRLTLISGSNFSIVGTVYSTPSGPYPAASCSGAGAVLSPGTTRCMIFTVHNNLKVPITVQTIVASLDPSYPAPPAPCTGPGLALPSYSGGFTVAAGATVDSPGVPMTLRNGATSPDACQGATFHFVFSGTATYTEVYETSVLLASSRSPSAIGQQVTYTATVTAAATTSQDAVPAGPSGTVTFSDDGTTVCTAVPLRSASATTSTATCSPPAYSVVGTHLVTAAYTNIDGNDHDSTSNTLTETVNPAATTTVLASSPNPSTYGQPVALDATVTSASGPIPTGSVSFYEGTPGGAHLLLGVGSLSGTGQASTSTSSFGGGADSIYAVYSGSTNASGSTSTPIGQKVPYSYCITAGTPGSLTVTSGQDVCITSAGAVSGNVTVSSGGRLDLLGGSVGGDLTIDGGGAVNVSGGSLSGNLDAASPTFATVCGARISGNVTVTRSTAFVLIGDGGDDGAPGCAGNTVNGNLSVSTGSAGAEISGNTVRGGITLSGTTGSPAGAGRDDENAVPEVEKNVVGGGLSCTGNMPAPIDDGLPNEVSGQRSGQCSAAGS